MTHRMRYLSIATSLLATAGTAVAFDFKGLALGEPTTDADVQGRLGVKCAAGYQGSRVCNGVTSVAGFSALANVVIRDGVLQRVKLDVSSQWFDAIDEQLQQKLGPPTQQPESTLQNAYGAQYRQVERIWTDEAGTTVIFRKYAGTLKSSVLYFGTVHDLEHTSQVNKGKKGDL